MRRKVLCVALALAFFIASVDTLGFASGSGTFEKEKITISMVGKAGSIEVGKDAIVKGEGLGGNGSVVSIAILPANISTNDMEKMYQNMIFLYSGAIGDSKGAIKNGKFSVRVSFVSSYVAQNIKKGSYKILVWWMPKGGKEEKASISRSAFTTKGDTSIVPIKSALWETSSMVEKTKSKWSIHMNSEDPIELSANGYMVIKGVKGKYSLLEEASAYLKIGEERIAMKPSISYSKTSGNYEVKMELSDKVIIPGATDFDVVVSGVMNPPENYLNVFLGMYEGKEDLQAYASGNIQIVMVQPVITIATPPPTAVTLKPDKLSDPFDIKVDFTPLKGSEGRIVAALVDENEEPIIDGSVSIFNRENGMYTTQIEAAVVDGHAVFTGVKFGTLSNITTKQVKLKFTDQYNFTVIPVYSELITITQE